MSNNRQSKFDNGDKVTVTSALYMKPIAHGTIERNTLKSGKVLVRVIGSIDDPTWEVPVKLVMIGHVAIAF